MAFRRKNEAYRFSELFESLGPFLHMELLRANGKDSNTASHGASALLSAREQEVLKWLFEGKNNLEIGKILRISERTVKFHIQNLFRKFGAFNRYQLIANAAMSRFKELFLSYHV